MIRLTGTAFLLSFQSLLFFVSATSTADAQLGVQAGDGSSQAAVWTTRDAQHVYGLPEAKPNEKGTLALSATDLTFTGKTGNLAILRKDLIAVSVGNQRVEMWGMKGRLLRMAIPDGGGLAAAAFMHHRVSVLTVEFSDSKGGYHGAVFYLQSADADRAIHAFAETSSVPREAKSNACQFAAAYPRSLLVQAPVSELTDLPAAYRVLVYEHLIDRLRKARGVERVFRDGESSGDHLCPQFTLGLSVSGFKQGSQVERAVMGPVGLFMGTTQMTFDMNVTGLSGAMNVREQVKATVRGESESMSVAGSVAKKIAKQYSAALKSKGAAENAR